MGNPARVKKRMPIHTMEEEKIETNTIVIEEVIVFTIMMDTRENEGLSREK